MTILSGAGVVDGFYVNSTSSGVIRLWNNTTNSGEPISGNITPAIGSHNLFGLEGTVAIHVEIISGTINATFLVRDMDL